MSHDASVALLHALDRTAGKHNCIRDRSPQSLVDARPNSGSPGPFDPPEYRATPVKLQEPSARHADRGIHFGAGAAHHREQFARKAETCAAPGKVARRFLKHGDIPADLAQQASREQPPDRAANYQCAWHDLRSSFMQRAPRSRPASRQNWPRTRTITARKCEQRNGVRWSVCTAAMETRACRLRVSTGRTQTEDIESASPRMSGH